MWIKNKTGQSAKMGNEKVSLDGYSFSSKLEASVYQILKLRMKAGEIDSIECQHRIKVCGPVGHDCKTSERIEYIVDFKCTLPDKTSLFIEAKGFQTPEYRIKRRLWMHNNLGTLEVWGGHWKNPALVEILY